MQNYRFLLKFTGKEEEINLLGDGTEEPEFGEWSWLTPEQIIDQVSRPSLFQKYSISVMFISNHFGHSNFFAGCGFQETCL